MPSQGTQCTHFPLVHPSASVLLPELSCFWQLVSITRSSCAGRSYFPDSMKLLFLAEEKQLLSRETKLARLGSAVLWLLFLRLLPCTMMALSCRFTWQKITVPHSEGKHNILFFLTFSLYSTADTAARLSLCRGWVYAPNSCFRRFLFCLFWNGDNIFHNAERSNMH